MDRVNTGIPGLDGLIEGGFPHPSSILVTGPTGSGKSIFGLQFLYAGAKQFNEPGFMVNIEGYPNELRWYSERFNWDIGTMQKKGKLVFSSYDPVDFEKFELRTLHSEIIMQLNKIIDQIGAKRVVIDSITPLGQSVNEKARFRTLLYYISRSLKEKGCTTLFISEKTNDYLTAFDVEPFVMDGVIELSFSPREDTLNQVLIIRKMVATQFPMAKYLMDISGEGIRLATSYY
jgi:KaiC/GvpD/RAD55 family RecA-like ATPase